MRRILIKLIVGLILMVPLKEKQAWVGLGVTFSYLILTGTNLQQALRRVPTIALNYGSQVTIGIGSL